MAHAFEDKDLELLAKTMKLRERMMDNIAQRADADLPIKPSDLMAVTNLVESVDRSIYAKAKINIEDTSSKNEEATREVLRSLMKDLHQNKQAPYLETLAHTGHPPSYVSSTDISINEGELVRGADNCLPSA